MKVQPFQITKPLNENLIVQIDRSKAFYDILHQHNEIQLSLIVKGYGKLIVGDSIHQFHTGNFFAIGANSPHLFKSEKEQGNVHMITIFFTKETFGKEFFTLPDLEELSSFFNFVKEGFQLQSNHQKINDLFIRFPKASKTTRVLLFLELLQHLIHAKKTSLTNFTYPKETGNVAGKRMQTIFDYVLHHFQNDVKLATISELIHMTPNAFCKFFKQRTNKTFFQFLIELRLEHASQMLRANEDYSIAEIAEQSGFKSISNFNRKFKKQKRIVPSQYRMIKDQPVL